MSGEDEGKESAWYSDEETPPHERGRHFSINDSAVKVRNTPA